MSFSLGIAFGLAALLAYGASDFFSAIAARKIGAFKTMLLGDLIALVPLLAYAGFLEFPPISGIVLLMLLAASALFVVGSLAFLKALEKGVASVIVPVSANWVVVTVLLSIIFLHERLTPLQLTAFLLVVGGIALVSIKYSELRKLRVETTDSRWLVLAFVAMIAWGVEMFLFKPIVSAIGPMQTVVLTQALCVLLLLALTPTALARTRTRTKRGFHQIPWVVVTLAGLTLTTGYVAYNHGVSIEQASLVAPIAAPYAGVTVLLARIFLKEKLNATQYFGITLIILAIIMLSI